MDYLDDQFDALPKEEVRVKRTLAASQDTWVHVALYFIIPNGHGLKDVDLVCMKKLHQKVNLLPIIAKADTLKSDELLSLKAKILAELQANCVSTYQFPLEDQAVAEANMENNRHLPFAVVGSSDFHKVGEKMVRARRYPWGVVQVEDANHCDFTRLREMICTTERHYELYQREMLIMKIRVEDWNFINNNPGKIYNVHWSNLHDKEEQRREKFALRAKEKEEELENDHHTNLNKIKVMGNFLIFPLYI